MDKEALEKRIAEMTAHRDRLLAELNQTEGAILDSKYWLEKLSQPEAPMPEKEE